MSKRAPLNRFSLSVAILFSGTTLLSACGLTPVQTTPAAGLVVADHLNSPQGVFLSSDGALYITDSGTGGPDTYTVPGGPDGGGPTTAHTGMTAAVIRVSPSGQRSTVALVPSEREGTDTSGASRLTELGGQMYVSSGHWIAGASIQQPAHVGTLVRLGATLTDVGNLWAYESTNDPDKQGADSHPYALAAGPDGQLWVADAGGNDLLRVDPATGTVSLVTVFDPVANVNPPANTPPVSQAVPTGIAFLNDGSAYVSLLPGYPFLPGAGKVVRVAQDSSRSDYATGLTTVTDLRAGPDGNLYAVELGTFGAMGPTPGTGAIVRIKAGGVKETVLTGLNTPTSITFNAQGDAFLTVNGAAAPGTGQVLRWDRLTQRPALP
ncbi:ScyD/ScyE family protein [Deinococcus ruber]|uniref:ScyD/ScyE family protein n=1 Tax=Deinococcus ruber TaxID=1848197 RepID=A0A918FGQ5_9DEIO|nr:ScyD/ScyE family protein [Deinococcus ruber]GGR36620.1 hypothetical protein GCM10008957_52840 [Deinococcus ruber]